MSQNFPEDLSLGYGLVALCQGTGARASWLQKGTALIDSNLSFADSRIEKMAEIIDEMATSYATVGREMETAFFGFDEHFILAVCERSLRVVLFFPTDHEFNRSMTEVITTSRRFLRKNRPKVDSTLEATHPIFLKAGHDADSPEPTPVPQRPNPWFKLQPQLIYILSSAMTPAQAESLVTRTLNAKGINREPEKEEAAPLAREIFRKIPVPAQREELMEQLEEFLKEQHIA